MEINMVFFFIKDPNFLNIIIEILETLSLKNKLISGFIDVDMLLFVNE